MMVSRGVSMRERAFILLVVGVAAIAACSGTETDNSTLDPADQSATADGSIAATEMSTTMAAETASTASTVTVAPTATAATTTTVAVTTTTRASVAALGAGLFCRDIASLGYDYSDAVAYWVSEGSPDRMDADRNGIPCETVYDAADVLAFWGDPLPTTTVPVVSRWYGPTDPWSYPEPETPDIGLYGSACSPGTTALPDGIWFGFLDNHGERSIDFDLACLVVPDPEEEGGAAVRNDNPTIRTVAVDPSTPVHFIEGGWVTGVAPYRDWLMRGCAWRDEPCAVWLYVNDGAVTAIAEHFFAG